MAERHVLLLDPDKSFQDLLQRSLSPYGVALSIVDDGSDGLPRIREVSPELVLIAVETNNKHAYGTYSKVRKVLPKNVPIALVTATVSPGDFEKHKKLQTRADEYIDKRTTSREELVRIVDRLIELGPPQSESDELELNVDDAEEFSIEDLPMVEDVPPEAEPTSGGYEAEDATRVATTGSLVDEGIDAETEAAFAALGMGETPVVDESFEDDDAPATQLRSVNDPAVMALGGAEPAPVRVAAAPPPEPEPMLTTPAPATVVEAPAPGSDLDLGLDAVAEAAVEETSGRHAGGAGSARITELEEERDRLRKELDEARAKGGGGAPAPFSREREFKDLRERISRKEKELDDLKEEIESKEKQIATGKEKLKELDRKMRETEARLLDVEENLVGANAQVATLTQEKDKGLEREKGLKARLEIAQAEGRKAHEETEALRKKTAAEAATAADALAKERGDHERSKSEAQARLAALEAAHAAALRDAEEGRIAALGSLQQQLDDERAAQVAAIESDRAAKLEQLEKDHAAALAALGEEHDGEIAALHAAQEDALAGKDRERQAALAKAAQEREAALNAAEQRRIADLADAEEKRQADLQAQAEAHRDAVAQLEQAHAGERARLDAEKQAALAAAEKRRVEELAAADARRIQELADADNKHSEEIGALSASFDADKAELEAGHVAAVGQLRGEIEGLEQALTGARDRQKALEGTVAERDATIAERDAAIRGLEKEVADRDAKIAVLQGELAELEGQNAQFQEQVLKAYQKIKSDEATVGKAKKAMAIALTLLDGPNGQGHSANE